MYRNTFIVALVGNDDVKGFVVVVVAFFRGGALVRLVFFSACWECYTGDGRGRSAARYTVRWEKLTKKIQKTERRGKW